MCDERVSFQVSFLGIAMIVDLRLGAVDPTVLRDLQAHRSLDDTVASTSGGRLEG